MSEFDWLADLTQEIDMDAERVERMHEALLDHIATEPMRSEHLPVVEAHESSRLESARMRTYLPARLEESKQRSTRRRVAMALATVATTVIVAVVAITTVGTDPAEAIRNVAEVVAAIPDEGFTDTAVERRIDQTILIVESIDIGEPSTTEVAFLLPVTEVRRTAPDGSLQNEEIAGEPIFFMPVDDASKAIIRERYLVGETQVSTFPPSTPSDEAAILTDDPDLLADRINETISRFGPPEIPHEVQVVWAVASIYNATLPTPSERAALLEVLASTSGLEFQTSEHAGSIEVAANYRYDDGTAARLIIVLDAQGWLVRETESLLHGNDALSVPPGTAVFDRRFTPPMVS